MKLINKIIATTALTVAGLSATSANAATLLVSYAPIVDAAGSFSFNIDSNPTALSPESDSFRAAITNATGQVMNRTSITFFSLTAFGGFEQFYGPQVYTGATTSPTIKIGSYALANGANGGSGTLTISNAAGAVPEPATWAMMLVGVGMMGFAMRRRKVNMTVRFA